VPKSRAAAASRKLVHTRRIECAGYERADGLFDVEARLLDITPDGTDLLFKQLGPGEAIHGMRLQVTVDRDLRIRAVEAHMDTGPTPHCREAAPAYASLEGLTIGAGFRRKAQALVGGVAGCTHLTELLGPLATTAMQTVFAARRASGVLRRALEGDGPMARPFVIGTCRTYRPDSEATAVIWPPHRRGNDGAGTRADER
jgi:hypothetical protein